VLVKQGKYDHSATLVPTDSANSVEGKIRIRWESTKQIEYVLEEFVVSLDQLCRRKRRKPSRLGHLGKTPSEAPENEASDSEEERERRTIPTKKKRRFMKVNEEDNSSSDEEIILSKANKRNIFAELDEEEDESSSNEEISLPDAERKRKEKAATALKEIPGTHSSDINMALEEVGRPYGLQNTMTRIIQLQRIRKIHVGFKIHKYFMGKEYVGEVVGAPFRESNEIYWPVRYEDLDAEDMTYDDLLRWREERPRLPATCRGRPLQMLELFCGKAVVSQEFAQLKWACDSVDILEDSNATIKMDVLKMQCTDLKFVPDCIWASLPCQTYSNACGPHHRCPKSGNLDKTKVAREHDYLFLQMTKIMAWAREKHPHLIVVIENPNGKLKNMPLMVEFTKRFHLQSTVVDYCAFGRDEKKPTMIWTNCFELLCSLHEFTCKNKCNFGQQGYKHILPATSHTHDCSVIPQPLAEEVAECITAKFYMDRIRKRKAAPVT